MLTLFINYSLVVLLIYTKICRDVFNFIGHKMLERYMHTVGFILNHLMNWFVYIINIVNHVLSELLINVLIWFHSFNRDGDN